MNKLGVSIVAAILMAVGLLAACAPASTPALPPAAPAPAAQPAPALTPEEAAWAQVVEAAKKEGKVNAYSYSWVGDIGLAVERAFENRYGIDLEMITGRGAEFIERLKTERRMGRMVADITEGSALHLNNMKLEGLLASGADLPVLQEKGVWLVHPAALDPKNQMNLIRYQTMYTPYINTKQVKPAEVPTSWKDLLQPKWRGAMSLTEPNVSAGPYQLFVPLLDEKIWTEDFIKALYNQKLSYYNALPEEYLALARGEVLLQIRGTESVAARFAAEGAPIQAIDMKEGVVISVGTQAIVAGAPHPNAAKVLLNWLFIKEGQDVVGKASSMRMARNDIPDYRPQAVRVDPQKPIVMTIEHNAKATELFREKWFDKLTGRRG